MTTIATENDGDVATSSTTFDVTVTPGTGGGTVAVPLPPIVTVNPMVVDEDGTITLDIQVGADPADPSVPAPTITVVLNGIPADALVSGAFFNPINQTWVTDAATISSGGVTVTPAEDWSGPINITVDAIATNSFLMTATTDDVPALISVTPVADGPQIAFSTLGGDEDTAIAVDISLGLTDTNGTLNEQIVNMVRISVDSGATLSAGIPLGGGIYELTLAELAGLTVTPAFNIGTDIAITIQASTTEPDNGDTQVTIFNGVIPVKPIADAAITTVANASGDEDSAITLAGLSAALADTDGSEVLSVTISGVPAGSILSAGSNNGDGSWTLSTADLSGLAITPPANFSGSLVLTLTAFTLEATGASTSATSNFTVIVNPVADSAVLTPLPRTGEEGKPIDLDLNIQPGDITGQTLGENPAETVQLTLSGMSAGLLPVADGGSFTDQGGGTWLFIGSVADANSIAVVSAGLLGTFPIGVSLVMADGISIGTPVVGTIDLTVNTACGRNTRHSV
ncbi:MAG: hypothetical protein U5K75_11760 [Ahrensia sp.]|nr:hypothetical protein [Ahrensia sp.]